MMYLNSIRIVLLLEQYESIGQVVKNIILLLEQASYLLLL
jgi:hypothetical protein